MIHDSLKIGIDAALEKSREKLLSRRCHRRHARKLGYPFQPRNWSNGIHLFNRANSIGATPESLERPEEECKMCGVSRGKNSLRAAFLFSPFALSPFGEMAPQSTLFGDANCHRGKRISAAPLSPHVRFLQCGFYMSMAQNCTCSVPAAPLSHDSIP